MVDQITVNQHYIPQGVLKFFSNSSGQVVETLVEQKKIYVTSYENSMCERFTYEHRFFETNRVEKYFHRIEGYFPQAIQSILDTIKRFENKTCNFLEVKTIVSKYMREFLVFYYRSGALLTEFEFERENKEDKVLYMLEKILNSKYIKELGSSILKYYDIAILKSESKEFIMSDQYISTVALGIKNRFANISNRHMGLKDVLILIPLSCEYYIAFINGHSPDYIRINSINALTISETDEINTAILNNSYLKCIGLKKDSLERIKNNFLFESPSAIYAGGNNIHYYASLKKEVFFYPFDQNAWDMFCGHDWMKFSHLGRNDECACGSGKKFKNCCRDYYLVCKRMMDNIVRKTGDYRVHDECMVEKPISEINVGNSIERLLND